MTVPHEKMHATPVLSSTTAFPRCRRCPQCGRILVLVPRDELILDAEGGVMGCCAPMEKADHKGASVISSSQLVVRAGQLTC